jgi:hypothetical protein
MRKIFNHSAISNPQRLFPYCVAGNHFKAVFIMQFDYVSREVYVMIFAAVRRWDIGAMDR